ncbi:hypothetical protein F3Y22_tig00112968pilonHSYRG00037 [Hibiscus syriacus]|uniref:Uncharacterized protein n=1 Tax=Hibiscus syriacus TaxID=106335 RepID=A0A6A2XN64_HIBSY|nr:hypothetical protein F3Y22_tig00112968pilonHSYRG00037 [Hibiscus syriacus]
MKSSSSSATPMFRVDAETPCDSPNNSNDAVKTDLSAAASSSIPSNLQQPLKKQETDDALKFETTFDRLGELDFKYRDELSSSKMKGLPTDLDWEHARALFPFLGAFYDATLKMSSFSYVTSNYYFHVVFGIEMRINDKLNDPNSSIKLMASNMREKYHKYWGNVKNLNPLLFISMILDPRHKMDYVIFVIEEVYDAKKAEQLSEIILGDGELNVKLNLKARAFSASAKEKLEQWSLASTNKTLANTEIGPPLQDILYATYSVPLCHNSRRKNRGPHRQHHMQIKSQKIRISWAFSFLFLIELSRLLESNRPPSVVTDSVDLVNSRGGEASEMRCGLAK